MKKSSNQNDVLVQEQNSSANINAATDISSYAPSGKLDADQYTVDDLDGVMEGLVGSGNIAFTSLQASQTDLTMALNSGTYKPESADIIKNELPLSGASFPVSDIDISGEMLDTNSNNQELTDTDRPFGLSSSFTADGAGQENGNFTASTVGSVGASQHSINMGRAGGGGAAHDHSETAANSENIQNSVNVENISTVNNTNNIIEINSEETIENILTEFGDTINALTTSITNIHSTLNEILGSQNVTQLLNNSEAINLITSHVEIVTENIENSIYQLTEAAVEVTDFLQQTLSTGQTLIPDIQTLNDISGYIDHSLETLQTTLNNTINTLSVPDLSIVNTISNTIFNDLGVAGNILQSKTSLITQIINDVIEAGLDSLDLAGEGAGDTNILLGLETDLIETGGISVVPDPLFNQIEDLGGDIDVNLSVLSDLTGTAETDNEAGDQDITIAGDLDLVDSDLNEIIADIELDPFESLTGDLDIGLSLGADILEDISDPVIDDSPGGTGEETVLSVLGDTASDIMTEVVLENNAVSEILESVPVFDQEHDVLINTSDISEPVSELLEQLSDEDEPQESLEDLSETVNLTDVLEISPAELNLSGVETVFENNDINTSDDTDAEIESTEILADSLPEQDILNDVNMLDELAQNDLISESAIEEILGSEMQSLSDAVEEGAESVHAVSEAVDILSDQDVDIPSEEEEPQGIENNSENMNVGFSDPVIELFSDIGDAGENLTEEIDVDVDTAINLLNSVSENQDDDGVEISWTDNPESETGGLFDDVINTSVETDPLPDISGTVAEGIGVLQTEPHISIPHMGGLFG